MPTEALSIPKDLYNVLREIQEEQKDNTVMETIRELLRTHPKVIFINKKNKSK